MPMDERIITVMNQKGGVGKTTTTLNLGHALARMGSRILMIDMDPQAHLSSCFGLSEKSRGLSESLIDGVSINEVKVAVRNNLDIVPSGQDLMRFEKDREGGSKRGWVLKELLTQVNGYDFVLLDCPPSAALLTTNALFASNELLLPVTGDYLSLKGLSSMMGLLRHVEKRIHRKYQISILVTRYQGRRKLAQEVFSSLSKRFGKDVISKPIRECVAVAESPGFYKTIFDYRMKSPGSSDYMNLAVEMLAKGGRYGSGISESTSQSSYWKSPKFSIPGMGTDTDRGVSRHGMERTLIEDAVNV